MATRYRRHSNPFNIRQLYEQPKWHEVFGNEHPLHVEIGFGKGVFIKALAEENPQINFVGLEVRPHLVKALKSYIANEEKHNLYAVLCNANSHLLDLFAAQSVDTIYVNFPDPWYKKRHHKRRVINSDSLDKLEIVLQEQGSLLIATDYHDLAYAMLEDLQAHPAFENMHPESEFCPENISFGPQQTDREAWHSQQGDPIYRMRFRKTKR